MKERIEKKIEGSLFCHYSIDWVQKPLDFIPNFHCCLIFDCVVPCCTHLTFIDFIICLFISGK